MSKTHWPTNLSGIFEEPTVAETQNGDVLINMRMANDQQQCGGTHCRFGAISTDGGGSFSAAKPVPSLVSSGCQGSLLFHPPSQQILFSNPRSAHTRSNGTLSLSTDSGSSWGVHSTIDPGIFAYSCLSLLPRTGADGMALGGGVNSSNVGVLYEGHSGLLLFARPSVKTDDQIRSQSSRQPPSSTMRAQD